MQAGAERRTWPRVLTEASRVDVDLPGTAPLEGVLLDCSPGGYRVEAPAAPGIGQRVACTVQSFEREHSVSGVVAWRREDRFGAQFGVEVEAGERDALLAVMAACEPSAPGHAAVGERVKLHLPSVATPMRSRIKRVSHGEIVVGSTLEFLTVGLRATVENVDHGTLREAQVADVVIEVDEATGIPALLVRLRVDEVSG